MIAALLLVLLLWLARRDPGERIVTVAATPKIVTVPVLMPMPPPSPPAPPVPAPLPAPHVPHAPPPVQVRAAPTTPATPPPPPPPAPAPSPAAPSDVTTRYREVGQLLRTHGTDDLWQRYRWIRLGDCLQSEDKRSRCVQMLDAIASNARGK